MSMNKKNIWQIIVVSVVAISLLISLSVVTQRNQTVREEVQDIQRTEIVRINIEGLYIDKEVQVPLFTTALSLLEQLDRENEQVQLVTKEYPDFGVLVDSIGGRSNGENGEYWQYRVNGVMPQIGADKLELQSGDVVEWYFDVSEY